MEYYPFDSRNPLYKSHMGAIAEGTSLRLCVLLHRDAQVHKVFLVIRDDSQETAKELRMTPGEFLEDYRFYRCDISLTKGLYWYSFRYTSAHGAFAITRGEHSLGYVSGEGASWQLTVYDKNFRTPDWLDGGMIYQIFPDRFFASGKPKENIPSDRFLCKDWNKQPEYRQTDDPCSLGNDYYGGDLTGIEQKLDYLQELGVTCLYLNPIFEAHSNHRYNTADYLKIDTHLGTEEDLVSLINAAKKKGISIILDGVFSHTGDDSVYFNRYGRYPEKGAYQSTESPYFSWYKFRHHPDDYSAWWGVPSLPETQEDDLSFSQFITGENGLIRHWLQKGIRGWRLDVADELPDSFLDRIRLAVKAEGEDNFLLGEVWEDATNKISYGARRRFLRGRQLDSVMNYPLAEAIIAYVKGGNSRDLMDTVLDLTENYPPQSLRLLMNHIGTHDTERILTRLGRTNDVVGDRKWQSEQRLTEEETRRGVRLLKLAAALQYTLPGVPSLYYGDEAGLTGYGDPFCRTGYPWGKENTDLLAFYRKLGQFRRSAPAFASGDFIPVYANFGDFVFIRKKEDSAVLVAVNRWHEPSEILLPAGWENATAVFGTSPKEGKLLLDGEEFAVLTL